MAFDDAASFRRRLVRHGGVDPHPCHQVVAEVDLHRLARQQRRDIHIGPREGAPLPHLWVALHAIHPEGLHHIVLASGEIPVTRPAQQAQRLDTALSPPVSELDPGSLGCRSGHLRQQRPGGLLRGCRLQRHFC